MKKIISFIIAAIMVLTVLPAGNLTLVALAEENQVVVTFGLGWGSDGSVSPSTKMVTCGSTYDALPTPVRAGYDFCGWWTELGLPYFDPFLPHGLNNWGTQVFSSTTVTTTSAHTLYAKWNLKEYELKMDKNGGTGGHTPSEWLPAGTILTVHLSSYGSYNFICEYPFGYEPPMIIPMIINTCPEKPGCTFLGWSTSPTAATPISTYIMPASGATLYAVWKPAMVYGDVNSDGNIDSNDAGYIVDYENYLIMWDPVADSDRFQAADLNGDDNIDSNDAGLMVEVENFILTIDQTTGLAVPF